MPRRLLCLVLLALPASTLASNGYSEDATSMTQFKVTPFEIKLSPTPEALCNRETDLSEMIESTVSAKVKQRDPSLEYLLLANVKSCKWDGGSPGIRRRQLSEPPSTTFLFNGGVASFNPPNDVDVDEMDVDRMVRDAINTMSASDLVSPSQTSLASVTNFRYVSTIATAAPSPAPTPEEGPVNIVGSTSMGDYSLDPESRKVGTVLGSVFGALLVLTGMVMLFSKPLTRNASSILLADNDEKPVEPVDETATVVDEDDAMTDNGDVSEMAHYMPGELLDSVSVGSEWTTTSTTDGDSKATSHQRHSSDTWVAPETFEQDRHITLQKDMLQSEWSNVPQSQMPPPQEWASREAPTMSFEQAHGAQGEEIYLMPPSREKRLPEEHEV